MGNIMRKIILGLSMTGALALAPNIGVSAGNIMVTTVVNDFVVTGGNIGCPRGPWGNAFAVDISNLMGKMDERSMQELMDLIGQFESRHGVNVRSKTVVKDFQVESDNIRTSTTGPVDDLGAQLCGLAGAFV